MNHANVGLISGEVKKVGRLPVDVSIITDKSGVGCICFGDWVLDYCVSRFGESVSGSEPSGYNSLNFSFMSGAIVFQLARGDKFDQFRIGFESLNASRGSVRITLQVRYYHFDVNGKSSKRTDETSFTLDIETGRVAGSTDSVQLRKKTDVYRGFILGTKPDSSKFLILESSMLHCFYRQPLYFQGNDYYSIYSAYIAQRAKTEEQRQTFANMSPEQCYEIGQTMRYNINWESRKSEVLYKLCRSVAGQNADIREKLLGTGQQEIVCDMTPYHNVEIGVCTCPVHGGKGENLLGKAWMKVRAEYQDVMYKDVM